MRVNVFLIATAKMVFSALEIIATLSSWILLLNFQVNNSYRLCKALNKSNSGPSRELRDQALGWGIWTYLIL